MSKIILGVILYFNLISAYGDLHPECSLAPKKVLRDLIQKQDTSIELEFLMSEKVMDLLTTENGKVDGLLGDLEPPDWFVKLIREKSKRRDPMKVKWDELDFKTKRELIAYKTKFKSTSFFEDRVMAGIKVKDRITLNFPEKMKFLGKTYKPGVHKVNVSKIFGPVEYCCSDFGMKNLAAVELHFRTNLSSGQVSNDAWKFLDFSGIERSHQHAHTVAKIPKLRLKRKPVTTTAIMGDFFRRVNLAAEMHDIYFNSGKIHSVSSFGFSARVIFFDFLKRDVLQGVTKYFADISKGKNPKIGDDYKMGWVGMRGSDKYDEPGLWGLEYRAISEESDEKNVKVILDGVQAKMINQDFGITEARMEKWLKQVAKNPSLKRVPEKIADLLYQKDWFDLAELASPKVKDELRSNGLLSNLFTRLNLRKSSIYNKQLKMLVHDWSKDPLFFDKPGKIRKIEEAQVAALRRIREEVKVHKYNDPVLAGIMQDFFEDSGLMVDVFKSIGVVFE